MHNIYSDSKGKIIKIDNKINCSLETKLKILIKKRIHTKANPKKNVKTMAYIHCSQRYSIYQVKLKNHCSVALHRSWAFR